MASKQQRHLFWIIAIVVVIFIFSNGGFLGAVGETCVSNEPTTLETFKSSLLTLSDECDFTMEGSDVIDCSKDGSLTYAIFSEAHFGGCLAFQNNWMGSPYVTTITNVDIYTDSSVGTTNHYFCSDDDQFLIKAYNLQLATEYIDNFYTCTTDTGNGNGATNGNGNGDDDKRELKWFSKYPIPVDRENCPKSSFSCGFGYILANWAIWLIGLFMIFKLMFGRK